MSGADIRGGRLSGEQMSVHRVYRYINQDGFELPLALVGTLPVLYTVQYILVCPNH